MSSPHHMLKPEDWGRLVGYSVGVTWALVFGIWTPSSYQGTISLILVHIWSGLMGLGCVTGIVGVVTRRDLKVELSGIYLTLFGSVLYLVAQVGFSGQEWLDRVPLFLFITWHMALMLPRVFGLEAYRQSVRRIARGVRS